MIKSGDLTQRVTFQSATVTRDAIGGVVHTWADVVTTWCRLMQTAQTQDDKAGKPTHIATVEILIRPQDMAITPQMRAVVGSTRYRIVSLDPDYQRGAFINIQAMADE